MLQPWAGLCAQGLYQIMHEPVCLQQYAKQMPGWWDGYRSGRGKRTDRVAVRFVGVNAIVCSNTGYALLGMLQPGLLWIIPFF